MESLRSMHLGTDEVLRNLVHHIISTDRKRLNAATSRGSGSNRKTTNNQIQLYVADAANIYRSVCWTLKIISR
jgi:hypothetical protein